MPAHVDWTQTAALTVVVAFVAGGLLRWVIRPIMRTKTRADDFFDAWFGEPAREGFPPRHGVMYRLADHERRITDLETAQPNHDEQIAMWQAMAAIAEGRPVDDDLAT